MKALGYLIGVVTMFLVLYTLGFVLALVWPLLLVVYYVARGAGR